MAFIEALPMHEGVSSWEALLLKKEEISLSRQLWTTILQMSKEDQAIFRWWVEDTRIDFGSQITDFLKSFRVELKELEITDPLDPDTAAIQLCSRLALSQGRAGVREQDTWPSLCASRTRSL